MDPCEVEVNVEADIETIDAAAAALAMWGAARREDHRGSSMILNTFQPSVMVTASIPLLVYLLRGGGHHHMGAHDEVRHGLLVPGSDAFTRPRLLQPCPDECPLPPGRAEFGLTPCPCDIETACRLLLDIVDGTVAAEPLRQIHHQITDDRHRTQMTLSFTSVLHVTVLIEAAALLVARRWDIETDEVFAHTYAAVCEPAA